MSDTNGTAAAVAPAETKEDEPVFAGSDNFSITVESGVIDITARIGSQEEADRFVECFRQVVDVMAALGAPNVEKGS